MVTRHRRDDGGILILTLILVVIMSVIVVGLLQFVTVGLTTSDVASERTETNADSSNVMHWAIEQFAKKQYTPDGDCGPAPTYLSIAVPPEIVSNGSATTLECAQTNPINGEPVVHLIARSTGDQLRVVEATVETPQYSHGARVADWRVDIPIAVPAYTTTTTTTPTTTTTTTMAPANQPPIAADMTVNIGLDDPVFVFPVPATDPESAPMTVSITYSDSQITVSPTGGLNVSLQALSANSAAAGSSYTFRYTVDDPEPLTSNEGTVTVLVEATPTSSSTSTTTSTTTTTLAPNPACTFRVTSAQNGGNSGIGVLEVTNSGADFTGWQVEITQLNPARPWQFTWGAGVTATPTATGVRVAGGQTVTSTSPFSVSASLTQSNGNPKIVVNNTLTCTVLSP